MKPLKVAHLFGLLFLVWFGIIQGMTGEGLFMNSNKKIIAVLPAYNAEKTLRKTFDDIPKDLISDIILIDDCSQDNTVQVAESLGIKTFRHSENKGYGGNQKTCYTKALELGADVVIMIHPDYQYDPTIAPELIIPILEGKADAVFGSRIHNALKNKMPFWKYAGNIFLTAMENKILNMELSEYHSGFRAYSRGYLERINFHQNSDDFVFDTEIIVQGKIHGLRIQEVPIEVRYFPEASSITFGPSVVYGLKIIKTLVKYILHQYNIKKHEQFS